MLIALALAAFAVAGCGGGDGDAAGDKSAQELLQATFDDESSTISSGVLTVAAEIDGVDGVDALELSGPFESADGEGALPRFAFTLSVEGGGSTFEVGATSTGDEGFLCFQGADFAVPDELFEQFVSGYDEQRREAEDEVADRPALATLGIEPLRWVTDPERAGEADVGGVETVRVTAGVDVPKLLADVRKAADRAGEAAGRELTAGDVEQLAESVRSASVEVFTGKDDLRLRRLVVDLRLASGRAKLTLEIAGLDEPQKIEAPAEPKPLEDLVALLGAATGQGGATQGGADGREYLECIQQAGDDLAKAQDCAELL